ncbi:hypothetical protein B0T26DRAFT_750300 [Lasiosphaeria miniovina]|uniref:NADH dehydrogenase [ubiquinone] 1 alpha subcomplex subunit n=1 Tax=Lasiosphaeria miniovina TaxID=1954250 RepID=A0AA40AVU5_9PEZI|nr:uncharacterized protein B0T26DRAFT_750300 [Lasiosphaeria miniovina]KAK0722968.1 hypothetical protein B0T26DRAFT_750300 [Lasiosphaeria miniovina]
MAGKEITPLFRAWCRWKKLRLPWRRQFLVGLDLQGNTYWEFRNRGARVAEDGRWRRIVQYPSGTHLGDVKVPPLWHQWLRHTRHDPPSLAEQRGDVARQARMKVLAAQADARWAAKPSLLDALPRRQAPLPAFSPRPPVAAPHQEQQQQQPEPTESAAAGAPVDSSTSETAPPPRQDTWRKMQQDAKPAPAAAPGPDPWKKARGGPGEAWQPQAWSPGSPKKP